MKDREIEQLRLQIRDQQLALETFQQDYDAVVSRTTASTRSDVGDVAELRAEVMHVTRSLGSESSFTHDEAMVTNPRCHINQCDSLVRALHRERTRVAQLDAELETLRSAASHPPVAARAGADVDAKAASDQWTDSSWSARKQVGSQATELLGSVQSLWDQLVEGAEIMGVSEHWDRRDWMAPPAHAHGDHSPTHDGDNVSSIYRTLDACSAAINLMRQRLQATQLQALTDNNCAVQ
ncbi:hypothetical protein PINS_up001771 [Pythium insidiosum]|nr:hypothetical protein PINS_up001771 [Pythium insidiosum]